MKTCKKLGESKRLGDFFHVDHDHVTGHIRGLLCFRCNNAIGDLDERVDTVDAATAYLVAAETEAARRRARALVRSCARTGSLAPDDAADLLPG